MSKDNLEKIITACKGEEKNRRKLRKARKAEKRLAKRHGKEAKKATATYARMLETRKRVALLESREAML